MGNNYANYGLLKYLLFEGSERLTGKVDLTLWRGTWGGVIEAAMVEPGSF
jgi:hypothetical protein